jgi:hypothetical protein
MNQKINQEDGSTALLAGELKKQQLAHLMMNYHSN